MATFTGKLGDTKTSIYRKGMGEFEHSYRVLEYIVCEAPPNYPMPATRINALTATSYVDAVVFKLELACTSLGY